MPAANTAAHRRREVGSRLGYGIRAEQYHLVERWEGFRIEHPLRHVVDLRFSRREIELTSDSRWDNFEKGDEPATDASGSLDIERF